MKTHILFYACILAYLFSACSEIKRHRKDEPCATFYARLESEWNYNHDQQIFFIHGREFGIQLLRDRNCLKGLSERSVLKLFGKPSLRKGDSFYYFTHPACHGTEGLSSNACSYVEIKFSNAERKVTSLEYGATLSVN